jgi:carboxymethylenebutenolidase
MKDIAAAAAVVRNSGRTATVGYCWGGTLSYLAAGQLPLSCAVVYYGKVAAYLEQKPRCPVLFHFGAEDHSIPAADVAATRAATSVPSLVNLYEGAGHGFNCDQRQSYNPQAAALARTRTLEFLGRYLAGDNADKE